MIETPTVDGVDYMGHLHYRMHLRSSNVDKAIDKVLGFSIFLVSKNLWFAKKIIQKIPIYLLGFQNHEQRTDGLDTSDFKFFGQGLFLKNSRMKILNIARGMMNSPKSI
jgi:hypothetical protein